MIGSVTARPSPLAWLLIWPIRFYQRFISRYTPPTCRYYPCCSSYAIGALRTHGAAKGLALTAWRLLRCNPWSSGGIDPVPPRGQWRTEAGGDADAAEAGPVAARDADIAIAGAEPAPRADRSDTDLSGAASSASSGSPIAGRTAA